MRALVIALVLTACGGGGSKSSTMAKAGPSCGDVADSMVAMMAEGKESTKAFVDAKEDFVTLIRTRCDEDAWTAEAKQCLATMKSRADAERCSTLLTEQQQASLVRDQKAKFGAGSEHDPQEPAAPEPAAAPPAPVEAEKSEDQKKRAVPPKAPKTKKTGDPCDGGE